MSTPTVLSTLDRIRTKVRRLTSSPFPSQLENQEIDDQINTFYLFDMPEHLRLWNLRTEYNFYTDPNVDAYDFPRNDFFNIYQPIYIAGYQAFYTQSREQFFRIYPQLEFDESVATGDGATTAFTFTLNNTPVLRAYQYLPSTTIFSRVFISFTDANGNSIVARDNGTGGFVTEDGSTTMTGTINYSTGAVTGLDFNTYVPATIPPTDADIRAQYVSYEASRPEALLFYNNTLFVRPVPDKAYKVTMEVLQQPVILLNSNDNPALEEWWQYLAFGASKKILEERQQIATLANLIPMFKEQERLILRRTNQQLVQERSATIFTEQIAFPYGNFFNRF